MAQQTKFPSTSVYLLYRFILKALILLHLDTKMIQERVAYLIAAGKNQLTKAMWAL